MYMSCKYDLGENAGFFLFYFEIRGEKSHLFVGCTLTALEVCLTQVQLKGDLQIQSNL
jgi:hypothetical protein